MAVELVGIETCYRREEEIPARFKPCPCAAAVQITAPFCEPAIAARQHQQHRHHSLRRFRLSAEAEPPAFSPEKFTPNTSSASTPVHASFLPGLFL